MCVEWVQTKFCHIGHHEKNWLPLWYLLLTIIVIGESDCDSFWKEFKKDCLKCKSYTGSVIAPIKVFKKNHNLGKSCRKTVNTQQ